MAMDFERYKKINDDRLNCREMVDATVVSLYRNTGCGDGYRLYLKIEEAGPEPRILDASFTTTGCGFGFAALAMATEWARGKTLEAASSITPADIEALFEFPERRKAYPESAAAALRKAIADYRSGTGIPHGDGSSRAAVLLKYHEQGHLRAEDLSHVMLEGEDLRGADLEGADLRNAFLQKANLAGANLRRARLRGAYLNDCDLSGADLSGADLRWAKLTGARIEGARFDGALYDIGTRLGPGQLHLFKVMVQEGKGPYLEPDPSTPDERMAKKNLVGPSPSEEKA